MRVAAVQTTAGPDREENLAAAEDLVERAVGDGARLVVLPEYFSVAGSPRVLREQAEYLDGPTVSWAADLAGRLSIHLVAGSFPERSRDTVGKGGRLSNTSCLLGPTGSVDAVYRKIHLFDVTLGNTVVAESTTMAPGNDLCVGPIGDADAQPIRLGMSICYDLRFPELYRILTLLGATVICVPAAFTAITGPAHWELLLRARAVENQVFVVAAAQVGTLPAGMPACYGHSMVIDPWGTVLAERDEPTPGIVVADLDPGQQRRIRSELPVLANRRPEAYRWPHDSTRGTAGDGR